MDGLLPIWKPAGITSYDVIRRVKHDFLKTLTEKVKIGHAGTLDPFAEGVLILMLGKATRSFDEIQTWPKTYRAVARLGAQSDTLDRTGSIVTIPENQQSKATIDEIRAATQKFIGNIEQVVPQYSAAKYQGRALYSYARRGIETPEKKKIVTVYSLEVINASTDSAELLVTCSSGTYIRQLSYDIFRTLGIESYLDTLIRESVGRIGRDDCLTLDQVADVDTVARRVQLILGESEI